MGHYEHRVKSIYDIFNALLQKKINRNEWVRADGDCRCPVCDLKYKQHPNLIGKNEWLTVICTGDLYKL